MCKEGGKRRGRIERGNRRGRWRRTGRRWRSRGEEEEGERERKREEVPEVEEVWFDFKVVLIVKRLV